MCADEFPGGFIPLMPSLIPAGSLPVDRRSPDRSSGVVVGNSAQVLELTLKMVSTL